MGAEAIAELVRRVIDADPELRRCLERGVANYSEVARRVKAAVEEALGRSVSLEAVKAAVTRYARRLRSGGEGLGGSLLDVLGRSSLELMTDVFVATVRLEALRRLADAFPSLAGRARPLLLLQATRTVTVVAGSEVVEEVKRIAGGDLVEIQEGQSVIVVVSPREVVSTPGFIAHIASLLASNGINISQIESVYTDTVIVLDRRDALRAFELLDQAIRMARAASGGGG